MATKVKDTKDTEYQLRARRAILQSDFWQRVGRLEGLGCALEQIQAEHRKERKKMRKLSREMTRVDEALMAFPLRPERA